MESEDLGVVRKGWQRRRERVFQDHRKTLEQRRYYCHWEKAFEFQRQNCY